MEKARRLLLAVAVTASAAAAMLPAGRAGAQTMPWPGDSPRQAPAPWPGQAPAGMSPAMGAPAMGAPGMGAPPMGGGGMGGPGMGGGGPPPCMADFVKMREETEKRGKAAKAASERKVGREEMCKYITSYADAEAKWVNFTEKNTQTSCGIPVQVANQLKQVHASTEQTKQRICAAGGPAGIPAGPSLHDALEATATTMETAKKGNGTFDTLINSVR
jgi:hypothetical protein